jgi:hypothetical protein
MKTIITKYHGPSYSKGSRVSATDGDNRVMLSWDHGLNSSENHMAAARALAIRLKWTGTLIGGHTKTGMVFVFSSGESFTVTNNDFAGFASEVH